MGAPKTKTVGGGSATPVANQWNSFLGGMLPNQQQQQQQPQITGGAGMFRPPQIQMPQGGQQGFINPQMPNVGQGSGMGGLIDFSQQGIQPIMGSQYGLNPQNMPGGPAMTSGIANGGMQQFMQPFQMQQNQQPGVTNQLGAANGGFQGAINQLMNPNIGHAIQNNPFLQGQLGYNPQAQGLPNPNGVGQTDVGGFMNQFGTGAQLLQQFGIDPTTIGNLITNPGQNVQFANAGGNFDPQADPAFKAIQDIAAREKLNNVANLRERYGRTGNTLSSGASLAESQYLAEADPRMIKSLADVARDYRDMSIGAGSAANATNAALLNAQTSNIGNILSFLQGTGGQNLSAASGLQGQNAANQVNMFGQQSQNQLQNQQMQNQFQQFLGGMGLDMQQLAQSGQMGIVNNLFNAFMQTQGIGTPQAQTVQQPSALGQALGFASGIGQLGAGIAMGNPGMIFGGLGSLGGGNSGAGIDFGTRSGGAQPVFMNPQIPQISPTGPLIRPGSFGIGG